MDFIHIIWKYSQVLYSSISNASLFLIASELYCLHDSGIIYLLYDLIFRMGFYYLIEFSSLSKNMDYSCCCVPLWLLESSWKCFSPFSLQGRNPWLARCSPVVCEVINSLNCSPRDWNSRAGESGWQGGCVSIMKLREKRL